MDKYRIQHLKLCPYSMRTEHVEDLLQNFKEMGFNAVMIEYESVFPYKNLPELESKYSPDEIRRIDRKAKECELEIIPKGFSFSHANYITDIQRFKHLADGGGGLNLLLPESLSIVLNAADNLLELHPETKLMHLGGDEIFNFARAPETNAYAIKHGISKLYVQFANKLASELKKRGVRIAIWSDMLIRYPEAAQELDKSIVVFYWNYWSYSDRVHYLTIGGGMSDTFILDRKKIPGDLEKIYRVSLVREKSEIPIGHLEYFKDYLELNEDRSSCNGYPYFKWFKDLGLDVVASMLTYTEKGSFLTCMGEKSGHIRSFLGAARENSESGFMTCCWQDCWPLLESILPSLRFALNAERHPDASDEELFENTACEMGSFWTGTLLKNYFNIVRHFEYADILNPFWQRTPVSERIEWLSKSGWLDDDLERAAKTLENAEQFLNQLKDEAFTYEIFLVEDIKWRAECQLSYAGKVKIPNECLLKEGASLKKKAEKFTSLWFKDPCAQKYVSERYDQWR